MLAEALLPPLGGGCRNRIDGEGPQQKTLRREAVGGMEESGGGSNSDGW